MMHARSSAFGLAARLRALPAPPLEDVLVLEAGRVADYRALAAHHYRDGRPGAVSRVWRLVHRAPSVVGRYLGRRDETRIVGVLVLAMPVLNCRARTVATGGRYRGLSRREAAVALNREFRAISRVVIDPQWRGLGLSVRLVRQALDAAPTRYVEALATMGRVHPFFARAGMTPHESPPTPSDARLLESLEALNLPPRLLASAEALNARLDGLGAAARARLEAALRRWNQAACGRRRVQRDQASIESLLAAARLRLAARPVYYLTDRGAPERNR